MSSVPWAIRISQYLVEWGFEGITPPWEDEGSGIMIFNAPYELRKLEVQWARNPPGDGIPQDAAMCTFHLLNITDGEPDDTWTVDDYLTAEAVFDGFWDDILGMYAPEIVLNKYSWRRDGPAFKPFGASLSPVVRNVDRDVPGSHAVATLPPQVSVSVTEVTAAQFTVTDVEGSGTQIRNRWGRFYLPPPTTDALSNGRVSDAFASAVSSSTAAVYETLIASDFIPVMYSPTTGSAWSVDAIHVDDIFDVIRRRRFEGPLSRHVNAVAP